MAGGMQMNFDLRSLLQDDKYIEVDAVKKSHEVKAQSVISKGKNLHLLRSGKHMRDLHAELLIPQHITSTWKFQFNELRALKTRSDGNCMYRACSKLLCGHEDLWNLLRDLTSIELFKNQEFYAFHPYIKDKSHLFASENTAFSAAASDGALADGYERNNPSSRAVVIRREAIRNAVPDTFSSLLCMFALSSVVGMDITTVYPEEIGKETKYSNFLNGTISPRVASTLFSNACSNIPLILMWTTSGITVLPGLDSSFHPNHFVPLFYCFNGNSTPLPNPTLPEIVKTGQQLKITDVLKPKRKDQGATIKEPIDNSPLKSIPTAAGPSNKQGKEKRKQETESLPISKKIKVDTADVHPLDIGNFIGMELDDDKKFNVAKNHWCPPSTFDFPYRDFSSAISKKPNRRRFCFQWFSRWTWLCYSMLHDGAFCLCCVLFGKEVGHNGTKLSQLFKEPFTNWQCAAKRFESHEKNSVVHRDSMLRLSNFNKVMSGRSKGIDEQTDQQRSERIKRNRGILATIVDTVIFSGQQNIALRGHRDDAKDYSSSHAGNFQALLRYRGRGGDPTLIDHFRTAKKNATYRSKTTENKLIKICGKQIQGKIVSEITNSSSPVYSVLADEAADCGNKEQMPIVIRYVDSSKEINERFIKYVECEEGVTGEALAKYVEDTLAEVGLPLSNCRGQGYDGASSMSSKARGVCGRILRKNPKALYVHCSSHRLNLVVAKACTLPVVRNMLGQAKKIASFFSSSPKRGQYLSKKMEEYGLRSKKLAAPSTTRWVERITSLGGFVEAFTVVYNALKFMQEGGVNDEFSASSSDASMYFRTIDNFEFVVSLLVTQKVFDHTLALTVQLQQQKLDIAESLKQINLLKTQMAILRKSAEEFHSNWFDEAVDLAKDAGMNVPDGVHRICKVQTQRENYPVDKKRDLYRLKLTIPLLDHIITEIEARFPSAMCDVYRGFYILPSNFIHCKNIDWKMEFMKFVTAYKDDMPNTSAIHAELALWETSWRSGIEKVEYDNIADTLQNCNELSFPNIFVALKILAVIPVTTCECERSVSALRRMKTWLRSTMVNERLNGLAMMHINNDITVDIDQVVDVFARQNPTRMQFLDVLDDKQEEKP